MTYNDAEKTLTIAARQGSYSGMIEKQKVNVVYIGKEAANDILYSIEYTGEEVVVDLK